jgi:urease accessory protein
MERDAGRMREGGPTIFATVKKGVGVEHVVNMVLSAWKASGAYEESLKRWKAGGVRGSGEMPS